jgi:hypothetical protein
MRRHTPFRLQRPKRRKALFYSPNTSGRSRQGDPVRTIHNTPSTNLRLFRPALLGLRSSPMIGGAIRAHITSLSTKRFKTANTTSYQKQP